MKVIAYLLARNESQALVLNTAFKSQKPMWYADIVETNISFDRQNGGIDLDVSTLQLVDNNILVRLTRTDSHLFYYYLDHWIADLFGLRRYEIEIYSPT